jgi:hypothetical protein
MVNGLLSFFNKVRHFSTLTILGGTLCLLIDKHIRRARKGEKSFGSGL